MSDLHPDAVRRRAAADLAAVDAGPELQALPLRPPEPSELLKTPRMGFDGSGGFSDTLIELAGVLPYRAFFPEDVE